MKYRAVAGDAGTTLIDQYISITPRREQHCLGGRYPLSPAAQEKQLWMAYPKDRFVTSALDPDCFWGAWQRVVKKTTLPKLKAMLQDTGRWDMWDLDAAPGSKYDLAGSSGHLFWESDCAKWLEGACYFLRLWPDADLHRDVEALVTSMLNAQQEDGYLNINFTRTVPEKRWTNLRDWHEMYNAGHMFEAALAHYELTGSRRLLDAMLKFAKHISLRFGPHRNQSPGYPGHPEIELALIKLYSCTGEEFCLDLASYFLSERGNHHGLFFRNEQKARGEDERIIPGSWPSRHSEWYQQAHDLIVKQGRVEGHAVRVVYLLTALADLAALGKATDEQILALWRLWGNMINRNASVTGGIGTESQWEGFARVDYHLPQSTDEGGSYNETCAGIGLLMLADRLQLLKLDGPGVTDVAERVLYNSSMISGTSTDGALFSYENPLASSVHQACKRFPYFECSCCPPNVLRTAGVLGGYFWAPDCAGIVIHHFFSGQIRSGSLSVDMRTQYPWRGQVTLAVQGTGTVKVRIPAWSSFESESLDATTRYASFSAGHHIFDLNIKPRLIYSHPLTGKHEVALAYGPLIYCLEDVDNQWIQSNDDLKSLTIDASILSALKTSHLVTAQGQSIVLLHAAGMGRKFILPNDNVGLPERDQSSGKHLLLSEEPLDLVFIPYYFRGNRGGKRGSQMRVWIVNRGTAPYSTAGCDNGAESKLVEKCEPSVGPDAFNLRRTSSYRCVVM